MATVIDALVLTLGLDISKYEKNQENASKSLKKFGDESHRINKQAEEDAKKLTEGFDKVKNAVIGLAAVVIGFNGLKEFVSSMVTSNAALGRTSVILNMSARDLDAWGGAVESVGGTAQGFQQSMQNIEGGLQKFRMGMGGEEVVTALARLGVQAKNGTVNLVDLSAALVRVKNAQGVQAAMALGQQLGLDQGTFQMLLQGPAAVQALHDKMYALSGVTEANTQAAQRLQAAWAQIKLASSGAANSIFSALTPALEWAAQKMKAISNWARQNKDFVTGFFIGLAIAIGAVVVATLPITGTFLAIAAAVATVATVIGTLYAGWKAWLAYSSPTTRALGEIVHMLLDAIRMVGDYIAGIGVAAWHAYRDAASLMISSLVKAFPALGAAAKAVMDAWTFEVDGLAKVWHALADIIEHVWDLLKSAPAKVLNWIGGKLAAFTGDHYDNTNEQPAASIATDGSPSSAGASTGASNLPRGLRNNNPGNIRYGNFAKKYGATGQDDKGFAVFPTMQAGAAAMTGLLKSYASKGVDTISSIIARYAPSNENDTAAYVASVAKQTGINPNQHLSGGQYAQVQRAMAIQENGSKYSSMIGAGMNAGVQSGGTTTVQTNIQSINVQTAATDGAGTVRDMHKAISNNGLVNAGTYGVA